MDRRKFIKNTVGTATAFSVLSLMPPLIQKALAVNAHNLTKSIKDVEHIVILMQENRSFDHYFGAMKGVRGFGDRFGIPLENGKRVFVQSDGNRDYGPYRADKNKMNAALIHGTPHNFGDTQAAWNQGKYGFWPKFKTPYAMAYYTREEIPFQYALAEAFTISDAYHCSIATGTDPNRIMFFSGSNFDPEKRIAGINCTDQESEPVNLRCWIKHDPDTKQPYTMPEPGYQYQGNALKWDTIPDVLDRNKISWKIYQDPNDNWEGAMHGGLAFESFRNAIPGSSIYENGMKNWSLQDLENDVKNNTLPQVTWILPSQIESEHPSGPSSPNRGGDFTHQVLSAITSNPEVWSKTVFFLTFDENDGLFDHVPAPAVPSYNIDGSLAGKSTIDLKGMYFDTVKGGSKSQLNPKAKVYQDERDTISGNLRPWGLGPRVPMYVISPWSKGGWVDSQVADHTSVGQFIEKRFGVTIPAISPWHRSVCSDLTSAFDFKNPNDPELPTLPVTGNYQKIEADSKLLPSAASPEQLTALFQEKGTRFSRALPYELNTNLVKYEKQKEIKMEFTNMGLAGAVFHVYDKNHLEQIPKRYTVEAGKKLNDVWSIDNSIYDVEVFGPNGFFRRYFGSIQNKEVEVAVHYEKVSGAIKIEIGNSSSEAMELVIQPNVYAYETEVVTLKPFQKREVTLELKASGYWYDLSILDNSNAKFEYRLAGRIETGKSGISDPAMAINL